MQLTPPFSRAVNAAGYDPYYKHHSEQELISEIQRLAPDSDTPPTRHDLRENGQFGTSVYRSRFGSWNDALKAAGFQPGQVHNIGRDKLLNAIFDLAQRLDRTPTIEDMRSDGMYSEKPFRRVFGTWSEALQAAGLEPYSRFTLDDETDLLREIKSLADEFGRTPTAAEVRESGEYSIATYQNWFGSWNDAVRRAGLEPRIKGDGITELYGPGWSKYKREQIRERDEHTCWSCGISQSRHVDRHDSKLHVHHIQPAREFPDRHPSANVSSNLLTLCAICHKRWEESPKLIPTDETLPEYCEPADPSTSVTLSDYVSNSG